MVNSLWVCFFNFLSGDIKIFENQYWYINNMENEYSTHFTTLRSILYVFFKIPEFNRAAFWSKSAILHV